MRFESLESGKSLPYVKQSEGLCRHCQRRAHRDLRDENDLPNELTVFRFMTDAPIKLGCCLDNATLLRRTNEGALCCLARDIEDRALLETLGYFYLPT